MNHRSRSRWNFCKVAVLTVVALGVALPVTAAAEHSRSDRDRGDRHDRHDSRHDGKDSRHQGHDSRRDGRYDHARHDDRRHDGRLHDNSRRDYWYKGVFRPHRVRHQAPRYARGVHFRHEKTHFCRSHNQAFDSKDAFRRHNHRRHRISMWKLPWR